MSGLFLDFLFPMFRQCELHWLDVVDWAWFRVSVHVYKCYTTWHLDTCRHSANLCPAFLVAVTYVQLVVVNWTSPCQSVHVWDGRLPTPVGGPTSWNSLPDNLKNVNLSLQTFKCHLKTFFFS